MPPRILIIGDFFPQTGAHASPETVTDIDQFLQANRISMTLEFHRKFYDIEISNCKQLQPSSLLEQIEPLAQLYHCLGQFQALREQKVDMNALGRYLLSRAWEPAVARILQDGGFLSSNRSETPGIDAHTPGNDEVPPPPENMAKTAPKPAASDNLIDDLFDLVDHTPSSQPVPERGETPPRPASSPGRHDPIKSLVDHISRPVNPGSGGDVKSVQEQLKKLLFVYLDELLHLPQWQALESTWLSLRNLQPGGDCLVDIWHCGKSDLGGHLAAISHHCEHHDYHAVMADFDFSRNDEDLQLLSQLARLGENLQTAVISNVNEAFFPTAVHALVNPAQSLETAGYEKWHALRQKDCGRWLALFFNRSLTREPYHRLRNLFRYEESIGGSETLPWCRPSWLVLRMMFQSQRSLQWTCAITGKTNAIHGLPLTPQSTQRNTEIQPFQPVEYVFDLEAAEELSKAGINPLVFHPQRDYALLMAAQTVMAAPKFNTARERLLYQFLNSLPYQLFINRVVGLMRDFKIQLSGEPVSQQLPRWQQFLSSLIATTGDGGQAQCTEGDHDGKPYLHVQLLTGNLVMNHVPAEFHFPLSG